ncbi:MAG: YdcF family protein [Nanoarchaeota archaeon]|nr:YdcF family protein [Nanoarchaeota archaeon]MBU1622115.1 YdcF family protein [Nanoarchaeota archaeon]
MNIAVILGAAKPAMEERLEEALKREYNQIVITGTPEETHYLDNRLPDVDVAHYEAYSTFGNYVSVCDNTNEDDQLTFIGHESHTHRMKVYQEYFSKRDIENVVLQDSNLKARYRAFDRFSATVHRFGLRFLPKTMKNQARKGNSCLNRLIIPVKNKIMN